MLLYTDILTGDEMVSDAFPMTVIDDAIVEVDCAMVTVKPGADVDIGANPSAEGGEDEALEEGAIQVNNVVHSFRLNASSFDKKSYMTYIRGYLKAIKAKLQETNPERIPIFEAGATKLVKKVVANIKDYDFYVGESMNPDGMVALLNFREDGVTPYLIMLKDGLKEVKL
ncbi:hypothetical protein H4R33_005033 [Dimargaris cristalligena]|uniref:Translationally-controlled tumor protein homolog n=1 Tax=Dimargaris cristalligena TaxID=215637 RepID=A0A4Q0A087_9FUNG|nr:hypothetical protein H4R33_005033 [Dimargaris cristalligena]RKP38510.1 translationally-controlled tumor protein [Dimargaris cristalligena]|eukprot:RKP38510.1 translationally-controlled tumor protein [Dimargaris cristalligena]